MQSDRTVLAEKLVLALTARNLTITTAESCTGGMIAASIVDISGASACFNEGYITYSNEAKERILGVPDEMIRSFGVVSGPVVKAMAEGAAKAASADIAVAVSGIAGPLGGTPAKPVGTVFLGVYRSARAGADGREVCEAFEFHFEGDRSMIREQTVSISLQTVLDFLM